MPQAAEKQNVSQPEWRECVVTALGEESDVLWSQVWRTSNPFGLGFPFRWVLEKTENGVRIRRLGSRPDEVIDDPLQEVPFSDLIHSRPIELKSGGAKDTAPLRLRLSPVVSLARISSLAETNSWRPELVQERLPPIDKKPLKVSSLIVLGFLLVGVVLVLWMPTPKAETELIPAQFAKVLLSPALKAAKVDARSEAAKHSESHNVVQVFKSESVAKTTKALFNSGAAKALLSQSKLMDSGGGQSALKKVFESRSQLNAGGVGELGGKSGSVQSKNIGMLGSGGSGVGYADSKVTAGAVNGQGTTSGLVTFSAGTKGVDEGLTRDEVGKVIHDHLSEVRYCYESAMVRNPGLEGKVQVHFTIRPNGTVKSSDVTEGSGEASLDTCITSHLMRWRFPKPRGGVEVGVTYPFIFKSLSN